MCLSIEIDRPQDVLERGVCCGYRWVIVHNGMGVRCGYIRVDRSHPWYGLSIAQLDSLVDVHWGPTFAEADQPCDEESEKGWWIGFDCGHAFDNPDPDLPLDPVYAAARAIAPLPPWRCGTIRSQSYVRGECESLAAQALAADQSGRKKGLIA